jgi:hypothetical protein
VGYKSILDNNGLVGVNQRIIEEELARKKEEYLNHEELARIAKLYETNEVISIFKQPGRIYHMEPSSSIACYTDSNTDTSHC